VAATILYWVVVGALVGAVYGLLTYVIFNRGRRNFASGTGIKANRYEVLVDDFVADDALRKLDKAQRRESRSTT
jgi:hypothetical protein